MSGATPDSTTDDPRPDAEELVRDLASADDELERARERVDAVGEGELRVLADTYDEVTALFDRYEEEVTGDGDFETFIEFQGQIEAFTEELDDVRHRDVFEDVDDLLQQRRLTESDWEQVRSTLDPVRGDVERLEERDRARERYDDARFAVEHEITTLEGRIADLERLRRLGDADLDAPVERLRDPIETYDERVETAFASFRRGASAREVLRFVAATEAFPLVDFDAPPTDLREFVETHEAGTESISQLLEYADYSVSKLDHYVADPDSLKRNVSTRRTYLRRLDADPLAIGWPPPAADALRFRCRELTSVVARLPDSIDGRDDSLVALRAVRNLPTDTDYERLRDSAQARAQLGADERRRLERGAVADELAASRAAKSTLEDALDEYPPR